MVRHTQLFILTLILLLAAAARLTDIDAQSLWVDEGFTYFTTKQTNLLPILSIDVHPPLYFLLMNGWARLTGNSELALRYLSFLPGMLSIAVVYQIGSELVRQRGRNPDLSWIPVIGALLLALADIELDLAKEARMYTLHTLFAALSILAYLRWWRQPRPAYGLLLAVSSAALVYTNYLGVWTPLLIGLHVLLFLRGRQRIIAFGILSAAALLVLPWLLLVGVNQLGNGTGAERADASSFATL
ncbi:MAG: glycosyltransferase family 39 protein, partial [Anaerolineae bacterium]|nr:glycosyltransferase family 39 protein [Anaerolineae bacterium]